MNFIQITTAVLALFASTDWSNAEEIAATIATPVQRLKIDVYYESLCGDSMEFIRRHLYKAMIDNGWLQYTDLSFIPYGKVSSWTNDEGTTLLYCQHGNAECELNALHACFIEHNNSTEEQLKMINCLMNGYSTNIDKCATSLNMDVSAAKRCKATRSTPDILQKHGDKTGALDITFVPSITIDGHFNQWNQRSMIYNFKSVFCRNYKRKYNETLTHC